jgi:hypothetical protein
MYIIEARKREMPLTPIKPVWQVKHKFSTSPIVARNSQSSFKKAN